MKPKLQGEKQIKLQGKRPPSERVSVLGFKHPGSKEADWTMIDGAGWIIDVEHSDFHYFFKKCIMSGKWFHNSDVSIIIGEGVKEGSYMDSKLLGTPECPYARDEFTGYVYVKSEMVVVLNKYSNAMLVSKRTRNDRFALCDINKNYYPKDSIVNIAKNPFSIRYVFVDCFNAERPVVCYCANCNAASHISMVLNNHGIIRYNGSRICKECENKLRNSGIINAHHYKAAFHHVFTPRHNKLSGGSVESIRPRLFGVEVETEFNRSGLVSTGLNRFDVAREILSVMPAAFCVIKEDGSLVLNGKYTGDAAFDIDGKKNGKLYAGFEIVSAPADLAAHRASWPMLTKVSTHKHMRAWDTETCGLHIHVSREEMSTLQIGRILAFINHPVNRDFVRRIAGRAASKYAMLKDKRLSSSLYPERGDRDAARRVAVNVQNEDTVEFRIFRGTVRPCHIIRNLEFVDALCDYCAPAGRSFRDLFDPVLFMNFCLSSKKTWPIMASWLVTSGLINDPKMPKSSDHSKRVKYDIEEAIAIGPLAQIKSDWDAIGIKKKLDNHGWADNPFIKEEIREEELPRPAAPVPVRMPDDF